MCCSTGAGPKSENSCRACPQRARRVFRAARRSFGSTGSLFGSQGSGAISAHHVAAFSGVRPRRRMKPGKFQQIRPKTSSIRRQLTNQCSRSARDETGRLINDLGWRGSACSKRSCANSMSARRQPPCRFKGAWARIEPNSQRVFQRAELGRQLHVLAVVHETAMTE